MVVFKLVVIGLFGVAYACAAEASPIGTATGKPIYDVTRTIMLGAPDRWDYVTYDGATHRVYVAHGDRVSVVDAVTGSIIGNVSGMPGGTHGIGISNATGQGFTDDGKAGSVVPFDPITLKTRAPISVVADADGIVVDPESGHIFVSAVRLGNSA